MLSNKAYDILKDISLCWMPLGIAFLGVVLETLNLPYSGAILTILAGANTFLGGVVKFYKSKYDKEGE